MADQMTFSLSNVSLADLSDEQLLSIIEMRQKYSEEERRQLIRGLYYIALIDGDYSVGEKEFVENTAIALGIALFKELVDVPGSVQRISGKRLF